MTPILDRIQQFSDSCKSKLNWENERSDLRVLFNTGKIYKLSHKKLAWYLVVLGNTRDQKDEWLKSETERFSIIISQLIQVRISVRSYWLGWIAIGVALIAAAIAFAQMRHEQLHDSSTMPQFHEGTHSTTSPSTKGRQQP